MLRWKLRELLQSWHLLSYYGEGGPEILRLSRGLLCQSLRRLRLAVCQRMIAVMRFTIAVKRPMISIGPSLLLGSFPNKISVTLCYDRCKCW